MVGERASAVTVRFNKSEHKMLESLAKAQGVSISTILRMLVLRAHLDRFGFVEGEESMLQQPKYLTESLPLRIYRDGDTIVVGTKQKWRGFYPNPAAMQKHFHLAVVGVKDTLANIKARIGGELCIMLGPGGPTTAVGVDVNDRDTLMTPNDVRVVEEVV